MQIFTLRDIDAMIAETFYGWIKEEVYERTILAPPDSKGKRKAAIWSEISNGTHIPGYLPDYSTNSQAPGALAQVMTSLFEDQMQISFSRHQQEGWVCNLKSKKRNEVLVGKHPSLLACLICLRQIGIDIKENQVEIKESKPEIVK